MISMSRRPSKPFEAILVWKYSRFARSREDSIVYKTLLRKHGVNVLSITEPFEDTPTGRLLEAMIESLDEFYSANLGEEILRGLRESASRGFYVTGYTPFGYRRIKVKDGSKERTKLEPDPAKAAVVSRIFNEVSAGKGLKELGRELREEGVASPTGKGWGKTSLYHILTNEVYTGTLVWGRRSRRNHKQDVVKVKNAWPAVVDQVIFDRVQKVMKERSPVCSHPRRTESQYLLSGIAKCGNCGKALIGQEAKGGRFAYYVCGTLLKKGAGTCPTRYLNARRFESLVINKIKEHILTQDNLTKLVGLVNEEMDSFATGYRSRLEAVESELADVNRRLGHLYDALETGKLSLEDLAPRIQNLRHRQDQLEAAKQDIEDALLNRKAELADLNALVEYVEDLKTVLMDSPLTERRAFIRSFVKEVKVTGDEAILSYTIPLPPGGVTEEKAGVLSIVQHGSAYRIRTGDLLLEREVS
jgi:site-specific DNA recombinase